MKISFCSEIGMPSRSAEAVLTMKNCESFVRLGHEVLLLVPDIHEEGIEVKDLHEYYGVQKIFMLERLAWLPIPGRRLLCGFFAALNSRKKKCNLVYSRSLQAGFASTLLGIPTIFEYHTPIVDAGKFPDWQFKQLVKNKNFVKMVVITNALKEYYKKEYAIPADLIQVMPDAADDVTECETIPWDTDKLQVGYVGQLFPGKGAEIIAALAKECPWADFHCIGGVEKDIAHWRKETEGCQNIQFHGYVPYSETEKYRQSFDVLLAPYLRKVQGFGPAISNLSHWMSPLKIFEYMGSGKAIVCSDLPVLREVLVDNETALMCDPDDIQSWIAALERLRDNPGLRVQMGERVRKEFKGKYTWEARAKRIFKEVKI